MDKLKTIKFSGFLKKHLNSIISLVLLTLIVSFITYWRVLIQMDIGLLSDSVDFFTNALVFAGKGMGYSDLIRPPFFSFITSIFIRMGFTSLNTIFAVDGVFFVFGVIGLYLLLKIRFNELESFLGSLIYATFPIVLAVVGVGFSDLASVSLTIWTFYFTILAVKKDSRFFILSFPFAMLAFLARYNSALIIFPIFLYIFINSEDILSNHFKSIRNILIGILASLTLLIPFLLFFYQKFGNLFYPFINFASNASNPFSPQNASYNPNLLFYLDNFIYFIGIQGVLILLIIFICTLVYLILKTRKNLYNTENIFSKSIIFLHKMKLEKNITKLKVLGFVALLIGFILTFGHVAYLISEVLFFISIYLFYEILKNLNIKYFDFNILFFIWFMVFFIFHSIYMIKDNRYFVIMAPPVAYFLILGLSEITNRIQFKIKNRNLTFSIIAIILTFIIIMTSVSALPVIHQANNDTKVTNEKMKIISEWLVNYDPDYKNKNIYSDLWPNFSWYLQTNVKMVPIFKDNITYSNGVKNETFNQGDSIAFNDYLVKNNAYYYLSIRQGLNLTSYIPIKQFGNLIIYKIKY